MKQFTQRVRHNRRAFFNSQILVALIGLFLSIALHELFHVVVHWNHITRIELFPDHAALVAITSQTTSGYNVQLEELIAYTITLTVIATTAIIIGKMRDKKDTRSVAQTVFPRDKRMQQLSSLEFYELAVRVKLV